MQGFPLVSNPPAEEGRFGFGTTPAVEQIITRLAGNNRPSVSMMILINTATLIRNAANKGMTAQQVVDKVRQVMTTISNEISYICSDKWRDRQHNLLFYFAKNDKAIPPMYRRPQTSPTAALLDTAERLFVRTVKPGTQSEKNFHVHVMHADQIRVPSYKGLRDIIDKLSPPQAETYMISHMPLDYHLPTGTARQCWLFRSHTGSMVKMTPTDIGKIVFKNDDVPFYPCTHVLLGDKYLIKGSLATKAEKTKLFELAKRLTLSMRTNTYTLLKIKENGITLPYSLD